MSDVRLVKEMRLGDLPQTWGLVRIGTGPGRGEGTGFTSINEAKEFAGKYGLVIKEIENSQCTGLDLGRIKYS